MDSKFQDLVEQLEPKFQQLVSMDSVKVSSLPREMPTEGVYVFYEKGEPLYVGRTKRMKQRIKYHYQESAPDAPFAFRLARKLTKHKKAAYQKIGSRKDLLSKPEFREAYSKAKARIRKMDICFVEEKDQTKQALLEIYVAVALNTPYNDFETH